MPDFSGFGLPKQLGPNNLRDISRELGPAAYGTITKARAGVGPKLGLDPDQLAQADRYMEGSAYRDSGLLSKLLKLGLGAGYEGAKGLAQNLPDNFGGLGKDPGRDIWNNTIGKFSDFKMDNTTSPASLTNLKSYGYGMFSPNPEDEDIRYAGGRRMIAPR